MVLAFSKSMSDPNYMPVTRDLSKAKIDTLVKWLSNVTDDPVSPLRRNVQLAANQVPSTNASTSMAAVPEDKKSLMAIAMMREPHAPVMQISLGVEDS